MNIKEDLYPFYGFGNKNFIGTINLFDFCRDLNDKLVIYLKYYKEKVIFDDLISY